MSFQQQIMQSAQEIQAAAIDLAWREVQTEATQAYMHIAPPLPYYSKDSVQEYFAKINIPGLFQPFSQLPDPASYDSMIESLRQAMGLLRGVGIQDLIDPNDPLPVARTEFAKLTSAGALMPDWNSKAANSFKNDFLAPFSTYTQNQFLLIATLKSSAKAHQAIWDSARKDIIAIAARTLEALHYDPCHDKRNWKIVFMELAVLATLMVPIVGESIAAGVALTAIGTAATMAANATPLGNPDEQNYQGATAAGIIDAMQSGMKGLYQRIDWAQQEITRSLRTIIVAVDDQRSRLEAPRPFIADNPLTP